jgi:phosphopantothenoylcysteine decarboxylase / phosphopantothenate---cysteine ligase
VRRIDVETAAQLATAANEEFAAAQVLLMAAAPADFRPEAATGKLKREGAIDLHLEPTEDILAALSARRTDDQTVIGFAAEHGGDATQRARAKLSRKGADLIVLNDVSNPEIGFESHENAVTLITSDDEVTLSQAPKDEIAEQILDRVSTLRERGRQSPPAGGYSKRRPN